MAEFVILLEFEENQKNSKLLKALDSSVGKRFTIKRSNGKALIKETLFDALQMTIESSSDIDSISLLQKSDSSLKQLVMNADLWSSEYDEILRKIRYDRKLA